jgi:segregation and condensation protein A
VVSEESQVPAGSVGEDELPDDFTVKLERVFSGPMDLLLHLVREHEVEIHEIEIHRVVSDYLGYLEHLADLDIEAAGDFVVMAATLMAIK